MGRLRPKAVPESGKEDLPFCNPPSPTASNVYRAASRAAKGSEEVSNPPQLELSYPLGVKGQDARGLTWVGLLEATVIFVV